jgi:uncharacterized protein (TIGR02647 family)
MDLTPELVEELHILTLFDLSSHQSGIKVHHTAQAQSIAATKRLYTKGLLTREDGGYLTSLGLDAAEHAQGLMTILTTGQVRTGS